MKAPSPKHLQGKKTLPIVTFAVYKILGSSSSLLCVGFDVLLLQQLRRRYFVIFFTTINERVQVVTVFITSSPTRFFKCSRLRDVHVYYQCMSSAKSGYAANF